MSVDCKRGSLKVTINLNPAKASDVTTFRLPCISSMKLPEPHAMMEDAREHQNNASLTFQPKPTFDFSGYRPLIELKQKPSTPVTKQVVRKGKPPVAVTKCRHTTAKHYARGMCNSCYHSYGRTVRASNCEHTDKQVYARGLCQQCYSKEQYKRKLAKIALKGITKQITKY